MNSVDLYLNLLRELSSNISILPDKPRETIEANLRSLWLMAAGQPKSPEGSLLAGLPELSSEQVRKLQEMINLRIDGIPLAHLTKRQSFMGIEMIAGPGALIPRYETEILGFSALEILRQLAQERGFAKVIDLCTGSGNLALAMAYYEPNCMVYGSDISKEAVELANENAHYLGLEDRVKFFVGDLFKPLLEKSIGLVDMIICNPPYISSQHVSKMAHEISDYEPREAFDGGPFGISVMMELIKTGPTLLKSNSWLGFEVGLGQGDAIKRKLGRNEGFKEIRDFRDNEGQIRALFVLI